MMSKDADLSVYTRQVVKEETKKEFANLDLFKVGNELLRGKTNTLEFAMEEVSGRTAKRVCGRGALDELKPFFPHLILGATAIVGFVLYKREK